MCGLGKASTALEVLPLVLIARLILLSFKESHHATHMPSAQRRHLPKGDCAPVGLIYFTEERLSKTC